jgi:hypothetical protein
LAKRTRAGWFSGETARAGNETPAGDGTSVHTAAPSVVRTKEAQLPDPQGALPSTQPVREETNVTDSGTNPAGAAPRTSGGSADGGAFAAAGVVVLTAGKVVAGPARTGEVGGGEDRATLVWAVR